MPGVAVSPEDIESSLKDGDPGGFGSAEVLRDTISRTEPAISWREV